MAASPKFFFVHLQKTGGTALFQRLRDHFGASATYPLPDDSGGALAVTNVDHLVETYRQHRDDLQIITGHFPLCTVDALEEPFTTFTVLRDPVARTLSLLRRRHMVEERFQSLELEQIYDDASLHDIIHNHMVKMLSLTPGEMTSTPLMASVTFDETRLEVAKHNLEHRIDVFGLQERFDEFCADLERQFGWDLGPPRFANRTPSQPVSEDLKARIAADNQHDMDLYRFAVELADARRRTQTADRG